MAKTNFVNGQVVYDVWFNSVYGQGGEGGHVHDGVDSDGHAGKISLENHTTGKIDLDAQVKGKLDLESHSTGKIDLTTQVKGVLPEANGGGQQFTYVRALTSPGAGVSVNTKLLYKTPAPTPDYEFSIVTVVLGPITFDNANYPSSTSDTDILQVIFPTAPPISAPAFLPVADEIRLPLYFAAYLGSTKYINMGSLIIRRNPTFDDRFSILARTPPELDYLSSAHFSDMTSFDIIFQYLASTPT